MYIDIGSSALLENVTFIDFRQGFQSIINFAGSSLTLNSVTWNNIIISQEAEAAVIFQNSALSLMTTLQVNGGDVTALNNGFEYRPDMQFAGFLYSVGIGIVNITGVSFQYNLVPVGYAVTTPAYSNLGALLFFDSFLRLSVVNCTFQNNLVSEGIIKIISNLLIPRDTLNGELLYFNITHFSVQSCIYLNNSGYDGAMINVLMQADVFNVEIKDCEFNNCLTMGSGLVQIMSSQTLTEAEMNGANLAVIDNGIRSRVNFPKMWVNLVGSRFEECVVYANGLIYLYQLPNVQITNLQIWNSGDSLGVQNFYTITFLAFINSGNFYPNIPVVSLPTESCQSVVWLSAIYNLNITTSTLGANTCLSGSAGVVGTSLSGLSSISYLNLLSSTSYSDSLGAVLDLTFLDESSILQLTVTDNINQHPVGFGITQLSSLTSQISVSSSSFELNKTPSGGAMSCSGLVTIVLTSFRSNQSTGVQGAGLRYSPNPKAASLTLVSVEFRENFSISGGGLMVVDKSAIPTPLTLSIISSNFDSNTNTGAGSCMFIDSTVRLSLTSIVSHTIFNNNTSVGGCISTAFSQGILIYDNCVFRNNTGLSVGVMYSTNPASTPTAPSLVILQHSLIEFNSAQFIVDFVNPSMFSTGMSKNMTMQFNLGICMFFQYTYWTDEGSVFRNNSYLLGAAIGLNYYAQLTMTDTQFIGNGGSGYAGAMYVGLLSSITCSGCVFLENLGGQGGCVYTEQGAVVSFNSTVFSRNIGLLGASAIYSLGGPFTSVPSFIENCTFTDNVCATGGGTIYLVISDFVIQSSVIKHNFATLAPGVLSYLSTLSVIDSVFSDQDSDQGSFLASIATSTFNIVNCKFLRGSAQKSGGAIYVSNSGLTITACSFTNLRADSGAAVAIFAQSTVSILTSIFSDISGTHDNSGAVYTSGSSVYVYQTMFKSFTCGAVYGSLSSLHISTSQFLGYPGALDNGAAVTCVTCKSVEVDSIECGELQASSGACLRLTGSKDFTSIFSIANSQIHDNGNNVTGSVSLTSVNAVIRNNSFYNNSVSGETFGSAGEGGALYLSCASVNGCQVTVSLTNFTSNSARFSGGAIRWVDSKPVLSNVTFINNTAPYGPDIASYAVALTLQNVSTGPYQLENVASGQVSTQQIIAVLQDHYGQVTVHDNSSFADFFSATPEVATVSGVTRVIADQGIFSFSDFIISATPGSNVSLKLNTNGVNPNLQLASRDNLTYITQVSFLTSLRNCTIGESQESDLCLVCPAGKYSLDPSQVCQDCPSGAVCYGSYTIAPNPGYWRASKLSAAVWQCQYQPACLGSPIPPSPLSFTGECQMGYFGNMCQGCINGYSRLSEAECASCPSFAVNTVRVIGVSLTGLIAVFVIIKINLVSATRPRSLYSIYIKIFLNYLQLVMVTATFELNWPTTVVQVVQMQENAGSVSEQIFSFDCFIDTGNTDNQSTVVYTKVILVGMIPLFIFVGSLLIWSVIAIFKRKWVYIKSHMVNSIVILFFIVHSSLVRIMFSVFNCREINPGEYWLTSYMNIRCWDELHYRYALIVALPSIIGWGVMVPLGTLIYMTVRRHALDNIDMKIQFGFLYTGYQQRKYYWEFVILYRKLLIISISVFLTTVSVPIQALCCMLVLLFTFGLQVYHRPYIAPVLNEMEQRGIIVGGVTIYCGLFFLTRSLETYSNIVLFVVILMANAYFLLFWAVNVCQALLTLLKRCVPKMRLARIQYSRNPEAISPTTPGTVKAFSRSSVIVSGLESNVQDCEFVSDVSRISAVGNGLVPDNSVAEVSQEIG